MFVFCRQSLCLCHHYICLVLLGAVVASLEGELVVKDQQHLQWHLDPTNLRHCETLLDIVYAQVLQNCPAAQSVSNFKPGETRRVCEVAPWP